MKRSAINAIFHEARACFERHGWALPPEPRWDITDFGLGRFDEYGLVLINLAEEPEYCEKLMFARPGQRTPAHTHARKKEDIICRHGRMALRLWGGHPERGTSGDTLTLRVNGAPRAHVSGKVLVLEAGERVTLTPGVYHEFWPEAEDCIIGEVSTANDDANDNIFVDPAIGRFPGIEEDEPSTVRLISEP
ncbi:D-lyxose/D-mannose family sugar isomerase [Ruficoccus sp. ZRK36]|uniref:D-lyxose/D-mannose family sugar isomerase n=1 Tax=Ruficoccus sp. ZRK36 TaxID=2866311 RepID=UPI001C7388C3|nr:D-lyxose/D-mannose family sugar isomerase [Ruficoccus sp. ZRK36]QYY35397.1 D-lyxose/D-mannose family sugar isomerase [Ruficoccus sp. ZRK36]